MDIQHTDDGKKGSFFIEIDGKQVAEMTYVWEGNIKIIIEHTIVDDSLRGQGVGKKMVEKAVEFAREKNIKIVPICTFAKGVFDKVKEFSDVL